MSIPPVLATLLPHATLPLTWYVPVLDSAMVVTLAVVLFLSSSDVIIRRHGRLLPLAFVSLVLGVVWLQHMLTFPGVAPFKLPLVTNQTAPFLFQAGHIGTPALFAWILFHRAGPLARPRRSLFRTLALALGVSMAAVAVAVGLALILPPLIVNGRYTGLNTLCQAGPFLVLAFVAIFYRRARGAERRIESSVIAGLIFVSVETMVFMFMQARYDGFWYVGHGLMLLPCVALLVGTVGLYTAARRDAEGRMVSTFVELAGLHRDGHEFPVEVSVSAT